MKNIRFSKIHRGLFFWIPRTCRKTKREVSKVILIFEDFRQLSIFMDYRIPLEILDAGNPYCSKDSQHQEKIEKIMKSQIWVFGLIFCFLLAQRSVVNESVMYLRYGVYFHGLCDPFWHPTNQQFPTHLNAHCNCKGIPM